MATLAVTAAFAIIIATFIKIVLNYLNELKFCKGYTTPSLPLPIIGHSHLLYNINREDIVDTIIVFLITQHIVTMVDLNIMNFKDVSR